jgi:hypothetical protein
MRQAKGGPEWTQKWTTYRRVQPCVCGMDVAGGRSLLRELIAAFKGLIFSRYYCIYYGKPQIRHRLVVDFVFPNAEMWYVRAADRCRCTNF